MHRLELCFEVVSWFLVPGSQFIVQQMLDTGKLQGVEALLTKVAYNYSYLYLPPRW
jgi:hypothetical protein